MARDQVKEGSHATDVCTAFVGRNEVAEMTEVVQRMRGSVSAPLVVDSTELPVAEAGAEALWRQSNPQLDQFRGWRGDTAGAVQRLELARQFGAAVIALTIDEQGMAKRSQAKAGDRPAPARFRLADRHGSSPNRICSSIR